MNSKNVILSNLIWKFAERIAAQAVSLIVSVILARILMPEDYGAVSLILVFITIADVFVNNGFGAALIQKKDSDELDYSSILWVNMAISILLYFILFISAPVISEFYSSDLTLIIRVFSIRVIVAGFNSIQHAYVSKNMLFRKSFWSTLFGTILSGIVGVGIAFSGGGAWALVAQYLTNSFVDTVILFFTVGWRPQFIFALNRVKPLFLYGWRILFESLSNTIITQLRNLLIVKVYTSSDLAFYTKGQQFPNLLMANISTSISSVLFPAMSNENDNFENVKNIMRKAVRLSSFVLFPILICFMFVAEPFISLVLTSKWLPAVPYLKLFCLVFLLQIGMNPRHEAMKAIGRSDVYMNEHIIYRVIDIVLLLVFIRKGVFYILLSYLFSEIILTGILMYTSKVYTNYSYSEQIKDIMPVSMLTAMMACILYIVSWLPINSYIIMIIQIVIGAMSYLILAKLLNFEEFYYLYEKIKRIIKK